MNRTATNQKRWQDMPSAAVACVRSFRLPQTKPQGSFIEPRGYGREQHLAHPSGPAPMT